MAIPCHYFTSSYNTYLQNYRKKSNFEKKNRIANPLAEKSVATAGAPEKIKTSAGARTPTTGRSPMTARTPKSTKTSTAIGHQLHCCGWNALGSRANSSSRDATERRHDSHSRDATEQQARQQLQQDVNSTKVGRTARTLGAAR